MNDDLISRAEAVDVVEHITSSMSVCVNSYECHGMKRMQRQAVIELENLSSAQHTCETCCYWGNRMILRDGSLGDCGNFEKNLSKDFFCAWWSQKEKEGEQDG